MKKFISLFVSILMLICLTSMSAFASEVPLSDIEEKLVQITTQIHLCSGVVEYQNMQSKVLYDVFDKNGQNMTQQFVFETKEYVDDNNQAMIIEYCHNNVGYFVMTTESVVPMGTDLSKTITKNYVFEYTHSNNTSCMADFDITGSITYNPNTYQISYASTPRMSRWVKTAPETYTIRVQNTNYKSSIAGNKLSANFSFSFDIRATSSYNEDFIYGSPSGSFTIVPD